MSDSEPEEPGAGRRPERTFRVGDWHAHPDLGRVTHRSDGREVSLEPKVMEVLVCLARRPSEVVARTELMDLVWGDAHVGEDPLNRAISTLRKLFGDDARRPSYIETIHKRGYRLIAPVTADPAKVVAAAGRDDAIEATRDYAMAHAHAAEAHAGAHGRIDTDTAPRPRRDESWSPQRRAGVAAIGATLLVVAAVWLGRPVPAEEPPDLRPPARVSPVTTLPGREQTPALSPDGSRVAFTRRDPVTGGLAVFVTHAGGEQPLRLTTDESNHSQPAWSPDGTTIAFVRRTPDSCTVLLLPAMGGAERPVYDCVWIVGLDFSPDGRSLVFADRERSDDAYGLFALSLETGARHVLTRPEAGRSDTIPKVSPDGRQVAFRRTLDRAVQEIFLVPFAGGEARQFTFDREDIGGLDWTPSGGALVVSSNRGGTFGLWRLPLLGDGAEWLGYENAFLPSLARDAMVFERRSKNIDIWRVPLPRAPSDPPSAEATPSRWIASTRPDLEPRYSPDGSRIAFVSQRSGSHELWVGDADGNEPRRLTFLGDPAAGGLPSVTHPRWSPDGEQIVFAARIGGRFALHVVPAAGGVPRRLPGTGGNDRAPCWRGADEIWFASDASGAWRLSRAAPDGSTPQLVEAPEVRPYIECPAGGLLYATDRTGRMLRLRAAADGRVESLGHRIGPETVSGDWGATDAGLYAFVNSASRPSRGSGDEATGGGSQNEYSLGFWGAGRTPDWMLSLREKRPAGGQTMAAGGLSISPDRRWALYASIEGDESDIVIVRGLAIDP